MVIILLAHSCNEDSDNHGGYKMLQQTYYIVIMGKTSKVESRIRLLSN